MIYKSYPDISNFYIKLIDAYNGYNNDGYIDKYNSKNIRLLGPYTYDKYNNNDTLYYGKNIHLYKSLQYKLQLDKYK